MMTLFTPTLPGAEERLWQLTIHRLWIWLTILLTGLPEPSGDAQPLQSPTGFQAGSQPPDDLNGLRKLEPEAITQIHTRYFPAVYRFARYRLGDDALAEDVAGETFTRLLEHCSRGRGPDRNVRGWLLRTASNLVNDYYRAFYNKPTGELLESLASDAPGPAHQAEAADEKRALRAALQQLTEEQINVLALRFGSGLSLTETANVLGKKANAIKALQFRAIGALRKALTEDTDNTKA